MAVSPRIVFLLSLAGLLLVVAGTTALEAADWPGWRGPHQDGTSRAGGSFDAPQIGLDVAWARPLGIAYSGISVVDGRAVTMFGDGEFDWLTAMDGKSGKEIWRYKIDTMFAKVGGSDGGPVSVPLIADGVVYGLGAKGHLFAVRLQDGSEIWSMRIDEKLGARMPRFGFTTAPLIVGDGLFVQTGGSDGRSITGLDKRTGEVLWTAGDDAVGYQSPILADLAGRRQIVAVSNKLVSGLVPETGEVLWTHEHGTSERDGSSTPVLLGDDRFLLTGRQESAAFQLKKTSSGFAVDEVWRTTSFKQSFATPVLHEDHLYGFDGNFLTCVSPENGEKVWKSRPPGGRGLIVVDGHLIVFAADGMLVVGEASPEGYKEEARVRVSEVGSYTYPSFADGMIFVRNIRDIAGVKITRTTARPHGAQADSVPDNAFEHFVRQVRSTAGKRLVVDDFMNAQRSFPIVENDRWVHFVYRGEADDVAISGNMTEYQVEEPLQRIEGTDLFYKSYTIEPGARWEYKFNVDFENEQPDPLNPRRVAADRGDLSEVVTQGYAAAAHLKPYDGGNPGSLETFEHDSAVLGNKRKIHVYLPAGYADTKTRYPVLVINDGKDWLELGNLPNSLDNLIGSRIQPLIAVMVEQVPDAVRQEFGGARSGDYVRMLSEELIPHIDRTYRTLAAASSRAIVGTGSSALLAAYAAIERPDVFGKVGGFSIYLDDPLGGELISKIEQSTSGPKAQFRVLWNRYDLRREEWNVDLAKDSRLLTETLEAAGFEVAGGEALDGSGWGSWRARAGEVLWGFFPL